MTVETRMKIARTSRMSMLDSSYWILKRMFLETLDTPPKMQIFLFLHMHMVALTDLILLFVH